MIRKVISFRDFTSWPIRRKLLLLLLVVFLPAFGVIVATGINDRTDEIAKAQNNALLVVQSLRAQQEKVTITTKTMLTMLAQLPEVRRLDGRACSRLFRQIIEEYPFYAGILAASPDGKVFAASMPVKPGSLDISAWKPFRDAVKTLQFSAGEYVKASPTNVPLLDFSLPVLNERKELIAVLTVGFDLRQYTHFISEANLPEGYAITITDREGVRLFRLPEHDAVAPGKPLPAGRFKDMSGSLNLGFYEARGQDGIDRVYAFGQMRLHDDAPPYLVIIAGMAKDRLFREAGLKMTRNLLILGIATIVALILSWVFGSSILVEPMERLVASARRFAEGEMHIRTGLPHTGDEIGRLALAFDDMASQLERRMCEQEEVEKALGRINAELEHRVLDRTKDLSTSNTALVAEVAERNRAEVALRESELKYRLLVENAREAIYVVQQGVIVFANPMFAEMTGLDPSRMIGASIFEIIPPAEHGRLRSLHDRLVAGKAPHSVEEFRMPARGGDAERWMAINAVHILWHEAPAILNFATDITEEKIADEALKESEERYRSLVELSPGGIFVHLDGEVQFANRSFARMIGAETPEALRGVRALEFVHTDYRRMVKERAVSIVANGKPTPVMEEKFRRLDGSVIDVEVTGFPFNYRGQTAVMVVAEDISRRKKAEALLRESEERYRSIFENAVEGIYRLSPDGRLLDANPAFAHMYGYTTASDMLREVDDIGRMYVDRQDFARVRRLLEVHGVTRGVETEHLRKDESRFHVSLNARAVRGSNGEMLYYEGTAQDVTESKKLEDQLRHALKMEAVGQLAGGIAHDFNNILTVVTGFSALVRMAIDKQQPVNADYIDQILAASDKAANLTRSLLAFSRKQQITLAPP